MFLRDFDFDLPPELIAQTPAAPRDSSRLMHVRRESGAISHHRFSELPQLLRPDDLLVFNDTRVLRARLRGAKVRSDGSSGARLEALLLRQTERETWECLLRPSSRLRVGTELLFAPRELSAQTESEPRILARATILERLESSWIVRFSRFENESGNEVGGDLRAHLTQLGEVPLPPYITSPLENEAHYQTVFARENASREYSRRDALESSAAPTAGLHFTPRVLEELQTRGIRTANVTLQIGVGTFRPIKTETLEDHEMHREHFEISAETARQINAQKKRGARVVAIGTTTTRVLEAAAQRDGAFLGGENQLRAGQDSTDIFIKPGHAFRAVDAMLTNFHLPKSSLLVMISAFCEDASTRAAAFEKSQVANSLVGTQRVRYAYEQAVAARYRFFSFGDAMFLD